MGRDALARLFGLSGGFVSLYAFSALSVIPGGAQLSAAPGIEPGAPAQSAYSAIIVIGFVLFAVSVIGIAHLRDGAAGAGRRFPVVWLGDATIADLRTPSARLYVAFLAGVLLVLPAAALVHLNRELVVNGWVWNERLPASARASVACALPPWPFGDCSAPAARAGAAAVFSAPEVGNGTATTQPGRLWLVNHPCDLQWNRGLAGPQASTRLKEGGRPVSPDEEAARRNLDALPRALRDPLIAMLPKDGDEPSKDAGYCAGPRERSALCKTDETKCRGVEWLRIGSPALVIVASLLGWGGVLAFFVIWWRVERRPSIQPSGPLDKSAHDASRMDQQDSGHG